MKQFTFTIWYIMFLYISLLLISSTMAQILFPDEVADNLNSHIINRQGPKSPSSSSSSSTVVLFPDEVTSLNDKEHNKVLPDSSTVSSCTTPAGESGNCVPVSQCSDYLPLVSQMSDPIVLKFFRERICRLLPRSINICCPFGKPVLPVIRISQPPVIPTSQRQAIQTSQRPVIPTSQRPTIPTSQPQLTGSSVIPTERQCGLPGASRVIGGTESKPGAWPWLAIVGQFTEEGKLFVNCGGSLITNRHVITAAHCFNLIHEDPKVVRLGEHHLDNNDAGENPKDFRIVELSSHSYNRKTKENDIAILVLDHEAIFNDYVRPVCLPFKYRDNEFTDQSLTVVGFGRTSADSRETSKVPMEAKVPIVSESNCSAAYQRIISSPIIDNRQICAGDGGEDSCNSDSGGPLNYYDTGTGRYYLVGVVSFGVGCGLKEFPGVYTRVSSFLDWIEDNVN